jgi:protein O-GlcNAc transferase
MNRCIDTSHRFLQIFVSLHGNGLTNLIWMTPDAYGRSTVYEIQQKGMFMDDYAVLSEALGMEHWILGGRSEDRE